MVSTEGKRNQLLLEISVSPSLPITGRPGDSVRVMNQVEVNVTLDGFTANRSAKWILEGTKEESGIENELE